MAVPEETPSTSNGTTTTTTTVPKPPYGVPPWSRLPTLPASFPTQSTIPADLNIANLASTILTNFPRLAPCNFTHDSLWRDSFALTGTLRTFNSAKSIVAAWTETSTERQVAHFTVNEKGCRVMRLGEGIEWVDVAFTFQILGRPAASASGFASVVVDEGGEWRIWVLRTILEGLEGAGDVDVLEPRRKIVGNGISEVSDGTHSSVDHAINGDQTETYFDCVVVGGGQAGLSVGGRLQALGVSYVIIERSPEVGDSWRLRYDSTKLHTTREYSHLPFERTFTPEYREFLTKDDLAKGYKEWAKKYGINIWLSTTLVSGTWDKFRNQWTLDLQINDRHQSHQQVTAKHIIFAIGAGSQIPLMPLLSNQTNYRGTILHSSQYTSAQPWTGKKGIMIGSANTAHDIAEDMVSANLSQITMVQRSRTYVLPAEYFHKIANLTYNDKIPIEWADRLTFSNPVAVTRLMALRALHGAAAKEPERFDALERVGFKVERFGDIQHYLVERLGGHYMDVGCSAKIAEGLIKVKSDSPPTSYTPNGLLFADGTEIAADVIIFATGFLGNVREVVGSVLGKEVEEQIEDFWGLDEEGELYGAFKPSGHPGFWYLGGALGHARYYSRFVALQIKADLVGVRLPLYKDTPFPRGRNEGSEDRCF